MPSDADQLAASHRACRLLTRSAGSNFPAAFALLPAAKRQAMYALYAFMRHSDDLADDSPPGEDARAILTAWRTALVAAVEGRAAENLAALDPQGQAILPAVAQTVREFHIPLETLLAVLDGVEMDLAPRVYETFDELAVYCERVASAVGTACLHVWGFSSDDALAPGRSAGIALQLTNILRDLGEDARRGRIYLPQEDLRRFGYSRDELCRGTVNGAFERLMRFEIERAECYYREAATLARWLHRDGRRIFGLMMDRYHAILHAVARRPGDVFFPPHPREPMEEVVARCEMDLENRLMASDSLLPKNPKATVAVIGGGVAGLAAAVAAVERGFQVELFEQAPAPGGRAGSYQDTKAKQLVDLSTHLAMGCCTNFLDLCRRTEILDAFDRYTTLHFIGPDGTRYDFAPSRWLPAPLHLMPALKQLGYFTKQQRRAIGRTMLRLARTGGGDATMADWLHGRNEPEECVRYFWALVLESALGDSLEHVSVAAARKVFVDGFLAAREAYEVYLSRVPLGELWQRVGEWLTARGAKVCVRSRAERLKIDFAADEDIAGGKPVPRQIRVMLGDGTCRTFDGAIAAVSWKQFGNLLGADMVRRIPCAEAGAGLQPSPITALHLWFDRPLMDLPHAALVGRLSQWIFQSIRHTPCADVSSGTRSVPDTFHYTVVISASHALVGRDTKEVLQEVLAELGAIWPAAADAELMHHRVLTQPAAVFSARPGTETMRPAQATPIPGLYLAGDWTATGWPATMEGATRSGYLAVEAMLASFGRPNRVLVPDLQKNWLVRWLIK